MMQPNPLTPITSSMPASASNEAVLCDPFDDAMTELRILIAAARSIHSNASNRGVVTSDAVETLRNNLSEAEALLRLQQDVLQSVRTERLKPSAAAAVTWGPKWLSREAAIVDAANELHDVSLSAKRMIQAFDHQAAMKARQSEATARERQSKVPPLGGAAPRDEFIRSQLEEQSQTTADQEEALDRLHHGLYRIKDSASLMHEELGRQETMLNDAQRGIDSLKTKLEAANQRVDVLLSKMSDCKKICVIVVLCFILGALMLTVL